MRKALALMASHVTDESSAESSGASHVVSTAANIRIAFVGTYPPRRCGIATFTRDLAQAIGSSSERVLPMTLAVTDPGGQYEYPEDVRYEIRQAVKGDYARAAE